MWQGKMGVIWKIVTQFTQGKERSCMEEVLMSFTPSVPTNRCFTGLQHLIPIVSICWPEQPQNDFSDLCLLTRATTTHGSNTKRILRSLSPDQGDHNSRINHKTHSQISVSWPGRPQLTDQPQNTFSAYFCTSWDFAVFQEKAWNNMTPHWYISINLIPL
jgi:hypothetical protein